MIRLRGLTALITAAALACGLPAAATAGHSAKKKTSHCTHAKRGKNRCAKPHRHKTRGPSPLY